MIICKKCGAQQVDGTIFCAECGATMDQAEQKPQRQTTASLFQREVGESDLDLPDSPMVIPAPEEDLTSGTTIHLVILNSGKRLKLDLSNNLIIGRRDSKTGQAPDIDLGRYGGYESGVSRKHAIISIRDGTCVVEDLKSHNGTAINGRRIMPYQPMPVHHGDELKFGKLIMRIEFT
jgi:hypothetical protein